MTMRPTGQTQKVLLHLALGLGGSLLVLSGMYYAATRAGHDIEPAYLIEAIRASSRSLFLVYLLMTLLGILLRTWRYRVLLIASGEARLPTIKDLTLITTVRNMTVDLLPGRLGELVFVGLLHRRAGTRVASGLSALLFATLLDVLILAPITIVIGLVAGFPNKQPYLLALIALFVVLVFILGVRYIMPFFSRFFIKWSGASNPLLSKLSAFLEAIIEAVDATMKAGVFGSAIGLTLLIRISKYAGLLCLYYGLTQGSFPALADMQAVKVLGAMIASEMTASMPIPSLMSFGSWELGGMTLLAWFGAMPHDALMVMLGTHVQTQAMDYALGIVALAALLLVADGPLVRSRASNARKAILAGLFMIATIALAWFSLNSEPEPPGGAATDSSFKTVARPAEQPLPSWVDATDGFIVWSSNRSGNHDIWLMSLPDMRVRPLTDHPHTENFARISPDGRKVVFARSHKAWQSFRDDTPWDIWMVDINSGKQEKLAQWGISPAWSADGRFVTFQRNPRKIIALDLATREERVYFESGQDAAFKPRVNLLTPTLGPGDRMAFTYRDRGRPVNMIRDGEGQFVEVQSGACQAIWSPSGDFVTYIDDGGKQKNQIMHYDPLSGQKSVLLDLPGEFSHEYFAHLSQDEKFMVFAASDGGHEHDLANYELFLWPYGAAPSEAVRLTFNNVNDSWPDIWLRPE